MRIRISQREARNNAGSRSAPLGGQHGKSLQVDVFIHKITCSRWRRQHRHGSGIPGDSGDGGQATNASIAKAINIALDKSGNIYMAGLLSPQPPKTRGSKDSGERTNHPLHGASVSWEKTSR